MKLIKLFNKNKEQIIDRSLLDLIFPVGKTELFYDDLDHSSYCGFNWELTSIGRSPIGLNKNDPDFSYIGKQGGSKELQNHCHKSLIVDGQEFVWGGSNQGFLNILSSINPTWNGGSDGRPITTSYSGEGSSGNMHPYEVFAFWKRIK